MPLPHSPARRLAKSTLVVLALGGASLHCTEDAKVESPTSPPQQTNCTGTFSDGTSINVASPQPLVDVPGDQSFCDFHTFAWNEFLYLTQTVTDPNDGNASKPRFLSYAPWYNMLQPDGSPAPGAFPGGNTALQVHKLDQKQAGIGSDALVDVAGQTVLYDIRFNQPMYDFIVANNYYTQEGYYAFCQPVTPDQPFTACNNPTQIWLPPQTSGTAGMGSIEIKTSWRQFPGGDCPSTQMYCAGENLGLVGLHIAQKTVTHGEWIWASFEHVANAPDCAAGSSTPIAPLSPLGTAWSFFNPSTAPASVMETKTCDVSSSSTGQCNLDPHDPPGSNSNVFRQVNICRTDALPAGGANAANCALSSDAPLGNSAGNAACLNATLQPKLSGVWKNYQLIGTLWTQHTQAPDENFCIDFFQDCSSAPASTVKTAVGFPNLANATLETFLQIGSMSYDPSAKSGLSNANKAGCFGCHNPDAQNTDTDLSHFPSKFNDFTQVRVPATE